MSMPRDVDYVRDMLEAASKIQAFIADFELEQFIADERTNLAVIRLIEMIGEAASHVSAEFRAAHPTVPWRDTINTRNRLIHGYRTVRLDIVWKTVVEDIPALIARLAALLPPEEE